MSRPTNRATALTRPEIARVALDMVDRDGVDKFSMRLLAEALGVTTMAVYHHFENKAEVLQAAADQVWMEIATSLPQDDDPVEQLVQTMINVRRTFARHSDVTAYAFASPTTEEAVHLSALATTQLIERAGFRDEAVGLVYQAIATYTLGSALMHAERRIVDRAIRRPVSELGSLAPSAPDVGDSAVAYRSVREAMTDDPDLVRFERGLREILAGFTVRYVTSG